MSNQACCSRAVKEAAVPVSASDQVDRLREIEEVAARARRDARARLRDLGLELDRSSDLRHVATVLTGGPVEAKPNLQVGGRRMAGTLSWPNGSPRILFETYDPPVRQRFSIAHELGHFYLHAGPAGAAGSNCLQTQVDVGDTPFAGDMSERDEEADAFAGTLLLPAEALVADLAEFGCCAAFLAERYVVSEATTRRRIRTLERLDLC